MGTRINMPSSVAFIVVFFLAGLQREVESTSIRGVSLASLPFYDPSQNFSCLDGSRLLPFTSVNDDYCDCEDGSDEPGTSACPNGSFFCINAGYKGENILSSRVNDGVCDCCDGSDEYEDDVSCQNTCREKGREELEKLKRIREETEKGYKVKVDEMAKGKLRKQDNLQRLDSLKTLLETQKANLDELRSAKERAEAPEKEAKEKQEKQWEAEKETRKKEAERKAAEAGFQNLDTNKDGTLTTEELMTNQYLDKDVSDTEAKEILGGNDYVSLDTFHGLWETVKGRYVSVGRAKPAEETPHPESKEHVPKDSSPNEELEDFKPVGQAVQDGAAVDDTETEKDEDDEDEEEEAEEDKATTDSQSYAAKTDEPPPREEEETPEYDQETKRLMLIADEARSQFEDADGQVKKTEGQLSDIEKALAHDLGPDEEFSYLFGECYELPDREYLYRLCPFNEAVQAPKGGGADTSLGHWKGWVGTPNKYSRMRYDGGVGCWNGPARSTEVILQCGPTTQLVSVTEPNRCEYVMEFKTPSLCQDPTTLPHTHEEL